MLWLLSEAWANLSDAKDISESLLSVAAIPEKVILWAVSRVYDMLLAESEACPIWVTTEANMADRNRKPGLGARLKELAKSFAEKFAESLAPQPQLKPIRIPARTQARR